MNTIYMTYKKPIPPFVIRRWQLLNPTYKIDFSLDKDCFMFLKKNFNEYVAKLFTTIPIGMYKADLWRLCKLYINSGVYADVDLVPYINIDKLDKNITFYSCVTEHTQTIFQAFIVNFSNPKNPLLFIFLLSFLLNHPYKYSNGPTYDMYNILKYNLNENLISDKTYSINKIKLPIIIGKSSKPIKYILLHYFPNDIKYTIQIKPHPCQDNFEFKIKNNTLIVKRLDTSRGWDYNHSVDLCISSNEKIFLFKENLGPNNDATRSYVTHGSNKILDSRDLNYANSKGW